MKTRFLILGIIGIISAMSIILHTELFGENTTYGQCLITSSDDRGFTSSLDKVVTEKQCKQSCAWTDNIDSNEDRKVACKFQTISGYGWVTSPQEFEYLVDKLSLNPIQ